MGSRRLPGKSLLDLHGYPVVEWVYNRLKTTNLIDKIIFSIPNTEENDILSDYLLKIGTNVYRGSENDVVDRVYNTAKKYKIDVVIRVCADRPLICPNTIDTLVRYFLNNKCDYAYNHVPIDNNYPVGFGAEICSVPLLNEIKQKANTSDQREHLFNYILDNKDLYKICTFEPPDFLSYPNLKLDLDTNEEYLLLQQLNINISMNSKDIINNYLKHQKIDE
jgi:spore coat polysaccharide biosynthesis protein SpsF